MEAGGGHPRAERHRDVLERVLQGFRGLGLRFLGELAF